MSYSSLKLSDTDILVHTNSSRADLIFSLFRVFDNKNTQELDNHIEYGRYVSQSCSNNRLSQRNTPLSFKKRVRLESGHVLQNSFPRNVSHNGSNNNLQHPADSILKSQIISPLINIEEVNAKSKKVEHLSGNVDKPNNNRPKGKNLNILRDQLFKSENGNKPCKKKNLENEAGEKICTRRKRKLNEKIEEESKNKKKKMKILVRNEQTKVSTKIVLQDRKIRKDCDLPAPSSKRSKKNKLNVNKDVDKPKSLDRDEKPMTASQKKKDYLLRNAMAARKLREKNKEKEHEIEEEFEKLQSVHQKLCEKICSLMSDIDAYRKWAIKNGKILS